MARLDAAEAGTAVSPSYLDDAVHELDLVGVGRRGRQHEVRGQKQCLRNGQIAVQQVVLIDGQWSHRVSVQSVAAAMRVWSSSRDTAPTEASLTSCRPESRESKRNYVLLRLTCRT